MYTLAVVTIGLLRIMAVYSEKFITVVASLACRRFRRRAVENLQRDFAVLKGGGVKRNIYSVCAVSVLATGAEVYSTVPSALQATSVASLASEAPMVSFPTISAVPVSTLRNTMLPWIVTRVALWRR